MSTGAIYENDFTLYPPCDFETTSYNFGFAVFVVNYLFYEI